MVYGLLAASICISLMYNALLHGVRYTSLRAMLRFNALIALSASLLALLLFGRAEAPEKGTLAWGLTFGITTTLNLYVRAKALETGPLAPTMLIGSSSMILQTVVGSIVWCEQVTVGQMIGVALMMTAMVLSVIRKKEETFAGSGKWLLFCMALFVTNAMNGLIFKAHQSTGGASQYALFLSIGFFVGAALTALLSLLIRDQAEASALPLRWKMIVLGILAGFLLCGCNTLNSRLAGLIPSVILFPGFNGSVIVFSVPVSMLFFHEKVSRRQLAGIALAVAAILLLSNAIF